MATRWRAVVVLMPLALLAACAVQQPVALPSPTGLAAPVVTPVSTTVTPETTPTPSPTPAETPSVRVAPPTVAPAPNAIILGPTYLGQLKFGTPEKTDVALLKSRLGDPDDVFEGVFCELDPASPFSATYTYGSLSVVFLAKNTKSTSPRTLQGWSYALADGLTSTFALEGGLPADPTFEQLQQAYPQGKLARSEIGTVFTLPNGIQFIGSEEPDFVQSGPFAGCE